VGNHGPYSDKTQGARSPQVTENKWNTRADLVLHTAWTRPDTAYIFTQPQSAGQPEERPEAETGEAKLRSREMG